ncbi:MAG: GFA family protein [Kordiimonadaceae bacterium]|nr:GFA family protein [Kordiimonadaceae bacterium]
MKKGGCICRKARYEIDLSNVHTIACHCTECQKHIGAPFSIFSVVPKRQFKWLNEPNKSIAISNKANRLFCGHCGTYIKYEGVTTPHEAEINAMTLDDTSSLTVDVEIFTRSRLEWVAPLKGAAQFETTEHSPNKKNGN